MSNDFYIDSTTQDWSLEGGTTIRMCETLEELIRQQLAINLRMFRGEWFANLNYGVAYFNSVFGKRDAREVDAVFKETIRNTDGVLSISDYSSEIEPETRKYKLRFSVVTQTGNLDDIEVIL